MTRYYVNVSHLSDAELGFFGFYKVAEDENFVLLMTSKNGPQILDKRSPHVFVDDINDAIQMKAESGFTLT